MAESNHTPQENIQRYAAGPIVLEKAIANLPDTAFDLNLNNGGWSIRQIIHHIVDGDNLWKLAILAAIGKDGCLYDLRWYWSKPQDEWVLEWRYALRAVEPSLALLRANRQHTTQLIQQLTDAQDRTLVLPGLDGSTRTISVADILESQANHIDGHAKDIRKIRQLHKV